MPDLYSNIGEKIQQLREEAGLSQEEFARMLGYTSSAVISYYESGQRRIKIEEIIKIANIFEIDYHQLLPKEVDELIPLTDEAKKFRADRKEIKKFDSDQLEKDFQDKKGFKKMSEDL